MLSSAANVADLDLRNDEKSNGGGGSSDTNHSNNDEEELDPSRLENLLLDDRDDELTERHNGSNGALAQLIKINQDTRKSVWMEKEKAYLTGRLWCAALL